MDLRRASLSDYIHSPKCGISDYLSGQVPDYSSIIVKGETIAGLDVIPVGTIPPSLSKPYGTFILGTFCHIAGTAPYGV